VGVVLADDGVPLHVEVDQVEGSPVTVVYSHGFTAAHGEYLLQREALRGQVTQVFYDQRNHGQSGMSSHRNATFAQLGRDLQTVLDATCPTGPVVLVGHSMGGMTVMSWARLFPQEVGTRVVGAFLLATSAGDLVTGRLVSVLRRLGLLGPALLLIRLLAPLVNRLRKPGTRAGYAWTRKALFGRDDADPELVELVQAMLEATPFTHAAPFYPAFVHHDESAALPVLATIPTTVLCGTSDRLTPIEHSRRLAAALDAVLVEVPGCGHSVNVTRPDVVNGALVALLDRVARRTAA
jgi:pimeloyl-ACP methyl ester carboxylesterase